MKNFIRKTKRFIKDKNINVRIVFFFTIYLILLIKLATVREISNTLFFGTYSILITAYILSRFLVSYFYEPLPANGYEPSVTFVVPAKNEEELINKTLQRIYSANYPKNKIEVITINDGSTDDTLKEMQKVKKSHPDLTIVNWGKNRGKRHAMAKGIKQAKGEIIILIDSDSFIDADSVEHLVKYFKDPEVAAVAGHADVYNADKNLITKMQAVRYYIAFMVYKGSESLFNSVACCSGCYSAYRRKYVLEVLDEWFSQKFLGVNCTYGDDRSLTNYLLKKYKVKYSPEAQAWTTVPDTIHKFLKQQLRWKKSWIRESLKASAFIWKKHPLMAIGFYLGVILPLLAPIIVIRAMIWYPYITHKAPLFYIFGLLLMSFLYGLYYYIKKKDKIWFYGTIFALFYTFVLVWQMPYAIFSIRDSKWGTR